MYFANEKNRRESHRINVFLPVTMDSDEYGRFSGLAINISSGGIFIQTWDPIPIGSKLVVLIGSREGFLIDCVVKSHYYMTYKSDNHPASFTGMGLKFKNFENSSPIHEYIVSTLEN